MVRLSEMKEFIDYQFYCMEKDCKGFEENLAKFENELLSFCEQLGFKVLRDEHSVGFDIEDSKWGSCYIRILYFDDTVKNRLSYLEINDEVKSILQNRNDDMFMYLEHKDEKIYVPDSAQTLNEFKNIARDWNIYLKQRFIDKRKFEIEKDFYKDEDDVSEADVQEEKDSSDKPLPIHKRFAKNLLNVFKKDSK